MVLVPACMGSRRERCQICHGRGHVELQFIPEDDK